MMNENGLVNSLSLYRNYIREMNEYMVMGYASYTQEYYSYDEALTLYRLLQSEGRDVYIKENWDQRIFYVYVILPEDGVC